MKKLLLPSMLLALSAALHAGEVLQVKVKGMVCSFCAQGIEKMLKTRPEVKKVKVNMGDKRVEVRLKDGKDISDEDIKKIVAEAGYYAVDIERPAEAEKKDE